MKSITLKTARSFVQQREPFRVRNWHSPSGYSVLGNWFTARGAYVTGFSQWERGYAVYSFGPYWPLFVAMDIGGGTRWFENTGRYSVTTSKHQSMLHPRVETTGLSAEKMRYLVSHGYSALARLVVGASRDPNDPTFQQLMEG